MFIETLELRQLLSASLNPTTGLLTITGTNNNDRIAAYKYNGSLVVVQSTFVPGVSGQPGTVTTHRDTFDITKVKSILVNALDGNDSVNLSGGFAYQPRPDGATLASILPITSRLAIPSIINGGNGNDNLTGGGGIDVINGGAGNDRLYGLAGNDTLNGDDGRDYLNGGAGADNLNGGAGNDYIWAVDGAATDKIDGGTNDTPTATNPGDVAVIDKGDAVTNVEKVHTITLPPPPVV